MTEEDQRRRPTYVKDERQLLEAWLEFHRATLMVKCHGLSDEQRKARPIATSLLSLHGLVRHVAETERNWFARILDRNLELESIWTDRAIEGSPWLPLDAADWTSDQALWERQCSTSREISAAHSLDDVGYWRDKEVSLRSIYLHMIQEYARHNGHADLLRELLDGSTGL